MSWTQKTLGEIVNLKGGLTSLPAAGLMAPIRFSHLRDKRHAFGSRR